MQNVKWPLCCLAIVLSVANSSCSYTPVEAWEKGNLAKAVMKRPGNQHQQALEQHTDISKEATQGGLAKGAGGCGCN